MRDRSCEPSLDATDLPADAVRAVAPGGLGNMGPGLDVLGCALTGLADEVIAWREEEPGVRVVDPGHPDLPTDPARHASAIAAQAVLDRVAKGGSPTGGIGMRLIKGLPLAGGQGGSAASAVAGAAAANALLGEPLDDAGLIDAALVAESVVAGRHLDNIAPAVLGGIILVRSTEPADLIRIPAPRGLRIVLALPAMRLQTRDARAVLPAHVDRVTALHQAAQVAAIVAACMNGDLALLGRAIDDRIAEPSRAHLLPGFTEAKRAALAAGALGCSISGAGPTSFAFCGSDADAGRVALAMQDAYAERGVGSTTRIARVSDIGVRVDRIAEMRR
jgi:homoserine kinase